jgi:hypothetical protein
MTMLMKVANEQWCNSNKKDLPCYACSLSFECAFCPFFCPGSEGTFSCTCVCLAFFVLCFGFVRRGCYEDTDTRLNFAPS